MSMPHYQPTTLELRWHIEYLQTHRAARLRFPRDLERRFERDETVERSRHLAETTLWLILPNALFVLSDHMSIPERFKASLALRLVVFPLLAMLVHTVLRRNPTRPIRGFAVSALACVAAGTVLYLYRGQREVLVIDMQASLLLILLATNVVLRLRWRYSVLCAFACVATSLLFLRNDTVVNGNNRLHFGLIMCGSALLILLAAYNQEREKRLNYLLLLQNALATDELQRLNSHLTELSYSDGLTSLANRSAFDERFNGLWTWATRESLPLSIIMIDIDHFKTVNDTFGHLHGDEVIKRVGTLIQQSLRGARDFAARYGGEEFVVLLPDETIDNAMRVAERIRLLVRTAGSPAPSVEHPNTEALTTTVSCGVACQACGSYSDPKELLFAADEALYRAKALGRDRVSAA